MLGACWLVALLKHDESCHACMHASCHLTLHIMENKQHAIHEVYIKSTSLSMWLVDEGCAMQTLHAAIACCHVAVLVHEFACWGHVAIGLSSCSRNLALLAGSTPLMSSQTMHGQNHDAITRLFSH